MHATDRGPDSGAALEESLEDLVSRAHENGVPVEGAWDVADEDDVVQYTVEITRVRRTD